MRDVAPPDRPWAGQMRWTDLAFLHWPIAPAAIRELVPKGLELDTFEGDAWIAVVPFRMEGVRLRAAPPVPTAHAFAELNVRTYARAAGRAGVWFFSLDAGSRLAVKAARLLYNLPYFDAVFSVRVSPQLASDQRTAGGWIEYDCRRVHRGASTAHFAARYRPEGDPSEAVPGALEHFLVERYCLFTASPRGEIGIIDVDHQPWRLQRGRAEIEVNTMAEASGITLPHVPPLVHVAAPVDVRAWHRKMLDEG